MRVIRIAGGEPEYDTPPHIVEAMKRALDGGETHYGEFQHISQLREAIAEKYRGYGVEADPGRVLVTPGSTMAIYMVLKKLVGRGKEALVFDPCFFGYYDVAREAGVRLRRVRRRRGEWGFQVSDLYQATSEDTKALIVNSPDNPTGRVFSEEELRGIAEYSRETGVKVISDDIYDRILYDGAQFRSLAAFPGMEGRVVVINGLSKTYAMTGWRVGYIIAPSQEEYQALFETQMSTYLVVNRALQYAALEALTGPQDAVERMVEGYREKRGYVLDLWEDMPGVQVSKPQGAFYVFPDLSAYGLTSAQMAKYLREEAKVVLTPGHLFGEQGEGHLRNSFAQSMGDLEEGLSRVRKALAKLGPA